MSPPVKQCTFAGGEITPAAAARSDLSLYEKSAKTLRNMISMKHGGATGRPGTMYVGTTLNHGQPVRLIPFIFNETGLGQSYLLEFGTNYIAFYQNGAVVVSAPNTPYTIATPYLQADLATLQFDQSADIVTIVHPNYPPAELSRTGPTNWTLADIVFGINIAAGGNTIVISGGGSGSQEYVYSVASVDLNGNESPTPGATNVIAGVDTPSPTNPISLTWQGPASYPLNQVAFWNIYRALVSGSNVSTYGFVGTVPGTQRNFVDTVGSADFTNTGTSTSPFESLMGPGYYPSTVGFIQQRRCFAAWLNNPIGFAMSKPGSFSNFDVHTGATIPDDDPIFGSIAGQEVNAIQHLTELKFALMLTAGAEIYTQGNGSGVVTPSAINNSVQSSFGCAPLRVLKTGDILLFLQALGSKIRDFAFDFAVDGYRGNDISIFASHLFEGYQIVDWCYQKEPDSIIWAVRSDGVLLSCTYIREQQVLAWTHHDFTNGFVENVAAIPENGEYAVYAVIRRVINGATVRYVERLSSRIWLGPTIAVAAGTANTINDPIEAPFCDCSAQFDGRNTSAITMTLNADIVITTGVNDGISFQASSVNYLAIVPPGTYTIVTLINQVLISLALAQNEGWSIALVGGKVQISNTGVGVILQFNTGDPSYARSMGPTLGFPPNDYAGTVALAPNTPALSFTTDGTAYQQQLTLVSSAAYFGGGQTAQVGDQIFLEDAAWVLSQGAKGNQIRLTIQSIVNATIANVTPSGAVPAEFQAIATALWARAVQTVSGLTFLAGQEVSVWADRFVVASPLNSHYSVVYTVPTNGILTLDKPYSVIYVGLPIIQDIETLNLETYFGETIMGRRKRVAGLYAYIYQTRSFYAGSENPDTNNQNTSEDPLFQLFSLRTGINQKTYDQPPPLLTSQDYIITTARWNKSGSVFMRNVDPVPWTLLAVSPKEEDPVTTPYKRV